MLFEIMTYIRNFFPTEKRMTGKFKIEDGTISLDFVKDGQYFLIEGSTMNDDVYQYPVSKLMDEEFEGCITLLAPPKRFLDLVDEIESFAKSHKMDGLQSESFGGYSYSKVLNGAGGIADWKDVFRTRLNTWRKV